MIINDLDGYYIVFDTKNWNTELDTLVVNILICCLQRSLTKSVGEHLAMKSVKGEPRCQPLALIMC